MLVFSCSVDINNLRDYNILIYIYVYYIYICMLLLFLCFFLLVYAELFRSYYFVSHNKFFFFLLCSSCIICCSFSCSVIDFFTNVTFSCGQLINVKIFFSANHFIHSFADVKQGVVIVS